MTPKQERFVAEYLVDLNATQAAIRAGYSEKYADRQAHTLMLRPEIREQVEQNRAMAIEGAEMDAAAIVAKLESVVVRAFEMDTAPALGVTTKALELLGKRHAMFTDKQVVDATVAQKGPAEVPEPVNYAEWLASKRVAVAFPTTGGNGNGNGNRVAKALADDV